MYSSLLTDTLRPIVIFLLCCTQGIANATSGLTLNDIKVQANEHVKQCHYQDGTVSKHSIIQYDSDAEKSVTISYFTNPIASVSNPQVLLLAYSRCLDGDKLLIKDAEILGAYEVSAMPKQPTTRIGSASQLKNQMEIQSFFLTEKLDKQRQEGNNLFYIQLGLVDKQAYIQQNFTNITLSNLHYIIISDNGCPSLEQVKELISKPNAVCKNY